MAIELNQAVTHLKLLLTDDSYKMPDRTGITPLLKKAKENSLLSPLSAEKKFEELVICKLVDYFPEFHQVNFSELESYISVSDFAPENILVAFERFVYKPEENEDIILKGCVARSIQSFNNNSFTLEYLDSRFKPLRKLDPWLLAELIINISFIKGVPFISELLQTDYDASYLFSIIPKIIRNKTSAELSEAFSNWNRFFNPDDKELAAYYGENYGFNINNESGNLPAVKQSTAVTTSGVKSASVHSSKKAPSRTRGELYKTSKNRVEKSKVLKAIATSFSYFYSGNRETNYKSLNAGRKGTTQQPQLNRSLEKS